MRPFFRRDYQQLFDGLLEMMGSAQYASTHKDQMTLRDEAGDWAFIEANYVAYEPVQSFWTLQALRGASAEQPLYITWVVEDAVRCLLHFIEVPYVGGTAYAGVTTAADIAQRPQHYAMFQMRTYPLGTNQIISKIERVLDDDRYVIVGETRVLMWACGDVDVHLYSR